MAIEVVATKNGPYLLTGDLSQLDLRDGDGNLYDVAGKSRIFLCRCGEIGRASCRERVLASV